LETDRDTANETNRRRMCQSSRGGLYMTATRNSVRSKTHLMISLIVSLRLSLSLSRVCNLSETVCDDNPSLAFSLHDHAKHQDEYFGGEETTMTPLDAHFVPGRPGDFFARERTDISFYGYRAPADFFSAKRASVYMHVSSIPFTVGRSRKRMRNDFKPVENASSYKVDI